MHINDIDKLVRMKDQYLEVARLTGMVTGFTHYDIQIGDYSIKSILPQAVFVQIRDAIAPILVAHKEKLKAELMLIGVDDFGSAK